MKALNDLTAKNIYKNGINLLVIGILDSKMVKGEPRRGLSAILNAYAGLLLLLKSRLAEASAASDYSLVSVNLHPKLVNGQTVWMGDKKLNKTVDFRRIAENFKHIQDENADWAGLWKVMERLQSFRNDIEHKFSDEAENVVDARLADIRFAAEFVLRNALCADPQEELSEVWTWLAGQTDVATQLRKRQEKDFAELSWLHPRLPEMVKSHICPACGYPIIMLKDRAKECEAHKSTFKCGSCNATIEYPGLISSVLSSQIFDDVWRWKDEWSWNEHFCECPDCGECSFDADTMTCYCCSYHNEFICPRCMKHLTAAEIECQDQYNSDGYCFYCRNVMTNDD